MNKLAMLGSFISLLLIIPSNNASANECHQIDGNQEVTIDLRASISPSSTTNIKTGKNNTSQANYIQINPSYSSLQINLKLNHGFKVISKHGSTAVVSENGNISSLIIPFSSEPSESQVEFNSYSKDDSIVLSINNPNRKNLLIAYGMFDLIDRVERTSEQGKGRWPIYPTTGGRVAAEWLHVTKGWGELKNKGVPDQNGLKNQYLCHPLSQVARFKSSWNIEEWRPNVGLPATIAAKCNPGGGND
ncbi:MAG: DUF2599 domain-containing protein [Propionibacteriaceae bacterium]